MRLFIAIKLPNDQILELTHLPPSIRGVKRVPDNNRHLTLLFLGEKNESEYHEIINALYNITMSPFSIRISNNGIFKNRGKGSILWAGIEQNDNLIRLYNLIKNTLSQNINLQLDKKNFTPHITLGRTKSNVKESDLIPFLSSGLYNLKPFIIDSFSLFSSNLQPEGAIYTEEEIFYLEPLNE